MFFIFQSFFTSAFLLTVTYALEALLRFRRRLAERSIIAFDSLSVSSGFLFIFLLSNFFTRAKSVYLIIGQLFALLSHRQCSSLEIQYQPENQNLNRNEFDITLALTYGGGGPFHDVLSRLSSGQDWRDQALDSLNHALWRHACASSDLLFRQSGSFAWRAISCFSAKQSSQLSCPGLQGAQLLQSPS